MEEDSKRRADTDAAAAIPIADIADEGLLPPMGDLDELLDTDTLTLLRLLGMC
jgi:hypothetical protein